MNNYSDSTRGHFQNESYAKQLVSFEGMLFEGRSGVRNVTPTDIDGFVQLKKQKAFLFFELKHSGGMPEGQKDALADLCDAIIAGGKNAVVFLATHGTSNGETIKAKDAIVSEVYWKGKWRKPKKPEPLYEWRLCFIKSLKE